MELFMKKMYFSLFISILIINTVLSDDGFVENNLISGNLMLMNSTSIQMVEEFVGYKDGYFSTQFIFLNTTSDTQKVKIGFPVLGEISMGLPDESSEWESLPDSLKRKKIDEYYDFECFINGKFVPRVLEKADVDTNNKLYDYFYSLPIVFLPNEKIVIDNKYRALPITFRTSVGDSYTDIVYILQTGASWAGNINNAVIKFNTLESDSFKIEIDNISYCHFWSIYSKVTAEPHDYETLIEKGKIVYIWDYKDINPDFDIRCSWVRVPVWDAFFHNAYLVNYSNESTKERKELIKSLTSDNFDKYFDAYIAHVGQASNKFGRGDITDLVCPYYEDNKLDVLISACRFLINYVYARNNYIFKSEKINQFYSECPWYKGTVNKVTLSKKWQNDLNNLTRYEKLFTQIKKEAN